MDKSEEFSSNASVVYGDKNTVKRILAIISITVFFILTTN